MSDELDLSEEVLFGMEDQDEGQKAGRSVEEPEHEDLSGTDREQTTAGTNVAPLRIASRRNDLLPSKTLLV